MNSYTYAVERITPDTAAAILDGNAMNRSLRRRLVERFAADMTAGRWALNGQDILIAEDGTLLDGQHRLRAVIAADMPINMGVKRGLPVGSFETIDCGAPRSTADVLGFAGVKNANAVAASARLAMLYIAGQSFQNGPPPRPAMTEFISAHPYIVDVVNQAFNSRGYLTPGPLGAILFLGNINRRHDKSVTDFLAAVQDSSGLRKGDPPYALRDWAINERLRSRGAIPSGPCFSAVAKAWNAYVGGSEVRLLKPVAAPNRENTPIVGFRFDAQREAA